MLSFRFIFCSFHCNLNSKHVGATFVETRLVDRAKEKTVHVYEAKHFDGGLDFTLQPGRSRCVGIKKCAVLKWAFRWMERRFRPVNGIMDRPRYFRNGRPLLWTLAFVASLLDAERGRCLSRESANYAKNALRGINSIALFAQCLQTLIGFRARQLRQWLLREDICIMYSEERYVSLPKSGINKKKVVNKCECNLGQPSSDNRCLCTIIYKSDRLDKWTGFGGLLMGTIRFAGAINPFWRRIKGTLENWPSRQM